MAGRRRRATRPVSACAGANDETAAGPAGTWRPEERRRAFGEGSVPSAPGEAPGPLRRTFAAADEEGRPPRPTEPAVDVPGGPARLSAPQTAGHAAVPKRMWTARLAGAPLPLAEGCAQQGSPRFRPRVTHCPQEVPSIPSTSRHLLGSWGTGPPGSWCLLSTRLQAR